MLCSRNLPPFGDFVCDDGQLYCHQQKDTDLLSQAGMPYRTPQAAQAAQHFWSAFHSANYAASDQALSELMVAFAKRSRRYTFGLAGGTVQFLEGLGKEPCWLASPFPARAGHAEFVLR